MKALLIEGCRDCPFMVVVHREYLEDSRLIRCSHTAAPEHEEDVRKLNRVWQPFPFCPLPNYNPDGTDTET